MPAITQIVSRMRRYVAHGASTPIIVPIVAGRSVHSSVIIAVD